MWFGLTDATGANETRKTPAGLMICESPVQLLALRHRGAATQRSGP
jgi:hypothetical protein